MVSTTVQEILQCRHKALTTIHLHLDHLHTSSGNPGSSIQNHSKNYDLPRALVTLKHHEIRRVEIPLQPFYVAEPQWSNVQMAHLFGAVADLKDLESVTVKARTLAGNPFPIGLLAPVLWQGRHRLRYLHVDVQRLQCLPRAVRRVAQALTQQSCLEWVKLKYSKLLTNHNHSNNEMETVDFGAMDPILCILGKIPTLQHVQLVGTSEGEDNEFSFDDEEEEVFPRLNPGSLVQLLASPTLQELRLEWMDLDRVAIGSLSTALQSSSSTSSLQKLVLGLFPEEYASMKVFAGMLQHNQTLEVVHIHTSWRTTDKNDTDDSMEKFLLQIGKALRYNNRLTEFHLCGPTMEHGDMTPKAEETLVTALKWSNLVLTSLKIGTRDSREGEISGPIAHYLKLNQLNRQYYVKHYEHVTVKEWIEILAKAGSDLNSVFYFLLLNPFLFQHHQNSACDASSSAMSTSRSSLRRNNASTIRRQHHEEEEPLHTTPSSGRMLDNDSSQSNERTSALTQAVANMIENVATTMEIELQYRDEREQKLEQEVERLRRELASLKRKTKKRSSSSAAYI